ncbi:MAG: hypothetical protein ABS949_17075 [Solibacillus sp.]
MKETFSTLKKVKVIIATLMVILAILAFTNDRYYWLMNIVHLLIALSLILVGLQSFTQNKRNIFPYFIIVMALLIIFLSIQQLLHL